MVLGWIAGWVSVFWRVWGVMLRYWVILGGILVVLLGGVLLVFWGLRFSGGCWYGFGASLLGRLGTLRVLSRVMGNDELLV